MTISEFVCECGHKPIGFQDTKGNLNTAEEAAAKARCLFCNHCGRAYVIIKGCVSRMTKAEEFEIRMLHAEYLSQHAEMIKKSRGEA